MEFLIAIYLFLFGARLLCAGELSHREFNRKVNFLQNRAMKVSNHQREAYLKNLAEIKEHNEKFKKGLVSYKMNINQFADLTGEEFKNTLRALPYVKNRNNDNDGWISFPITNNDKVNNRKGTYYAPKNFIVQPKMDWREQGAVASIKDQGPCGGCYAFATVSAIESHYFIKHKKLVPLSEQQVVDCSKAHPPHGTGCSNGGYDFKVYEYGRDVGLMASNSYPFEFSDGPCRFRNNLVVVKLKGFQRVNISSVYDLEAAITLRGPASVIIRGKNIQFISGQQVLTGDWCNHTYNPLSHGVTVVGYDTTREGLKYWIIRNSWGSWGDEGYFYVESNEEDICGIALNALIPELD